MEKKSRLKIIIFCIMLFILMNYLNTKTLPGNDHNIQSKSIASAGRIIKKFSIDVRKSFFEHKFTLHPEGYTILLTGKIDYSRINITIDVHAKTTPEQIQQSAVTGKETLRGTCYSKKENNKHTYFCRINEKILGPYNENMEIYFSRDRSAYCLMGTEQHYFFHSDTRSGPFKNPSNPVITNDGKSFAFRYYGTTGSDSLKNCFGSIFQCGANITYCCSLSWLKYYSSGPAFFDTNKQSPYMMYDGHIMGPFYYVSEPILSPDGNKIAFHFKKEAGKLYLYNQATQKSVKTKIYNDYLYYNGSPHDVSGLRDFSIHRAGISNDMSKYCLSAFSDTGECKYIHINGITYGPFRAADFECYGNDIFVAIVEGESVSILKF